jgi:hypothetical protein
MSALLGQDSGAEDDAGEPAASSPDQRETSAPTSLAGGSPEPPGPAQDTPDPAPKPPGGSTADG